MLLERNIDLQQRQSQQISAQAIQSLTILQYSHAELTSYIEDQAERNPLIDVTMPQLPVQDALLASPRPDQPRHGATSPASSPNASGIRVRAAGGGATDTIDLIERTCSAQTTLRDHLLQQVALAFRDAEEAEIARNLVEHIDLDGYLRTNLSLLADLTGADETRVERVLAVVQGFEPVGVGARDLTECLRLQLEDRGMLSEAMGKLLTNLELLARFETAKLSRLLGVSSDDVLKMVRDIRTLDPKPGRRFDVEPTLPALPDVIVKHDRGSVTVELNTELLPRVLVDRRYYAEISGRAREDADKRYFVDCLTNANWLVKNLDQRAQTVLKVATEIAKHQEQFLKCGPQFLRPLSLKDVAEVVGVHQSTVCRAIANKYMMTSQGMFELKYFFSNSINAIEGGEEQSAETVRQKLQQLVEAETPANVLSDAALVSALRDEGIEIARRTVAKYRDMLRIPSSAQRRRKMRAQLEVGVV